MACDTIYKFVRDQTAYEILKECSKSTNFHDDARRTLAGSIVMTVYNNKTYKIDDVCFDKSPMFKFPKHDGSEISIQDYYKQQYQIDIRDTKQPLIECLPSVRDKRAGRAEKILLVPELCKMTGLTDKMRENFQLGKKIAEVSRLDPPRRIAALSKFSRSMQNNPKIQEDMAKWDLRLEPQLLKVLY